MKTFEDYLRDCHAELYTGEDDHMSDNFNDWLCDLEGEDWLTYGEEFAKRLQQ